MSGRLTRGGWWLALLGLIVASGMVRLVGSQLIQKYIITRPEFLLDPALIEHLLNVGLATAVLTFVAIAPFAFLAVAGRLNDIGRPFWFAFPLVLPSLIKIITYKDLYRYEAQGYGWISPVYTSYGWWVEALGWAMWIPFFLYLGIAGTKHVVVKTGG